MKNSILTSLFALLFMSSSFSQIGFSVGYKHLDATNWENLIANYNVSVEDGLSPLKEGTDFAFDYWFRLKKRRVEFHPELSYSRFIRNSKDIDLKTGMINFSFHTNIYPFDFGEDCNCPTFSKDGSFMEKGLFLQISPVVSYMSNSFTDEAGTEKNNDIAYGLGLGVGIDFGLSDFITITPILRYSYLLDAEWKDLDKHLNRDFEGAADKNVSDITTLYIGFRLGFRFDERNKYGYR